MKPLLLCLGLALMLASCGDGITGKVQTSYENGQPAKVFCYDRDGYKVAEKEYYESGMLKMEGTIVNNLREGIWVSYFPDGKVQSTGVYKNGLRIGPSKVYYENGHLWMDGFYSNGHKCGEWIFYDEQGYEINRQDFGPCD